MDSKINLFQKALNKEFAEAKTFDITMFDVSKVIDKKLMDITLQDMGDYEEFTLIFEDGATIEIILTEDKLINIQTD